MASPGSVSSSRRGGDTPPPLVPGRESREPACEGTVRSPPQLRSYGALAVGDAPLEKGGEPSEGVAGGAGGFGHDFGTLTVLKPELDEHVSVAAFVWSAVAAQECTGEGGQGLEEVRLALDVVLVPAEALFAAEARDLKWIAPLRLFEGHGTRPPADVYGAGAPDVVHCGPGWLAVEPDGWWRTWARRRPGRMFGGGTDDAAYQGRRVVHGQRSARHKLARGGVPCESSDVAVLVGGGEARAQGPDVAERF